MLYWLDDNSLWLMILLGCWAAAILYMWWVNRKKEWLIALGAVLGLIALLWLLDWIIVTDWEQINGSLQEMAAAVGQKKPANIVKHLTEDFEFRSLRKQDVHDAALASIRAYDLEFVKVWNTSIKELSRSDGTAHVEFFVRVDVGGALKMFRCESVFVLESDRWRMQAFEIFNPVVGKDEPLQFVIPRR